MKKLNAVKTKVNVTNNVDTSISSAKQNIEKANNIMKNHLVVVDQLIKQSCEDIDNAITHSMVKLKELGINKVVFGTQENELKFSFNITEENRGNDIDHEIIVKPYSLELGSNGKAGFNVMLEDDENYTPDYDFQNIQTITQNMLEGGFDQYGGYGNTLLGDRSFALSHLYQFINLNKFLIEFIDLYQKGGNYSRFAQIMTPDDFEERGEEIEDMVDEKYQEILSNLEDTDKILVI